MKIYNLNKEAIRVGWLPCRLPATARCGIPGLAACFFVKGTFRLRPGEPAGRWDDKPEVGSGDVPVDGNPKLGLAYATDFVPFKPNGEFSACATFYPPAPDLAVSEARIRIGSRSKTLVVYGRRQWKFGIAGEAPGPPSPLERLPIVHANAWGGPAYRDNPLGRGVEGLDMHQIERSGGRVEKRTTQFMPGSFCPISAEWPQRKDKLGKFDPEWLRSRWPWLPDETDCSYYNSAPPGQWTEGYWKGDEEIELENLRPDAALYQSALPGLRARCLVEQVIDGKTRFFEIPLDLDTVWLKPDDEKLILVWRGRTPTNSLKMRDFEKLLALVEPLSEEPKSLDACAALLAEAVEARKPKLPEMPRFPTVEEIQAEVQSALDDGLAEMEAQKTDFLKEIPSPDQERAREILIADKRFRDEFAAASKNAIAKAQPNTDALAHIPASLKEIAERSIAAMKVDAEKAAPLRELVDKTSAAIAQFAGAEAELAAKQKEIEDQIAAAFPEGFEPRVDLEESERARRLATTRNFRRTRLEGADFSGRDLSRCDFSGSLLGKANLSKANLSGADCRKADFRGADLTGANLSGAKLTGALFRGAKLDGAIWRGADLSGARLNKLDLSGADFSETTGKLANFSDSLLAGARFCGSELVTALFMRCRMDGADFTGAKMVRPVFSGSSVRNAKMHDAQLLQMRATRKADFTGSQFQRSVCDGSVWKFATARDANFQQCSLVRADFSESHLERSIFDRCVLTKSGFEDANLEEAILTNANLLRVRFERANLTCARLDGSNLYQAGFWDANLRGATWRNANIKRTRLMISAPK